MSDLLKDFQKGATKAPATNDNGETRDSGIYIYIIQIS